MLFRKFANITWVVGSPSAYVCHGHPQIHALFNGKNWRIQKVDKTFPSMIALSLHVEKAQKDRKGTRKPRGAVI